MNNFHDVSCVIANIEFIVSIFSDIYLEVGGVSGWVW
jgi:hypothetical protein